MDTRFLAGSAAIISALMLTPAGAQSQSAAQANKSPPGAVSGLPEGVRAVQLPPAGFDAMAASPAIGFGFALPPAPNAKADAKSYAKWLRAVAEPLKEGKSPSVKPMLTQTSISNGPAKIVGTSAPSKVGNGVVSTNSGNWSGTAEYGIANPFNREAIIGDFVVPTAHQAFGACTGGWDWSSAWPGIDGFGSGDVLQGGVEVDAYCSGSTKASFYSAWIEWYPFNETRVSSPTISPGDFLFVEVWNVSTTQGYVYFHNYSTNETAEYALTAPSGTTLAGTSAEWVVERPSVGGSPATLTNYIDVPLPYGVAWDYTASPATYYYPNDNPSIGTRYIIQMLDDNGAGISYGYGESFWSLFFENYGSSCGLANSPPC